MSVPSTANSTIALPRSDSFTGAPVLVECVRLHLDPERGQEGHDHRRRTLGSNRDHAVLLVHIDREPVAIGAEAVGQDIAAATWTIAQRATGLGRGASTFVHRRDGDVPRPHPHRELRDAEQADDGEDGHRQEFDEGRAALTAGPCAIPAAG